MSKSKRREARLAKKAAREAKSAEKRGEKSSNGKDDQDTSTDTYLKEIKLQKATAKGRFTRVKNQLLLILEDPDTSQADISELTEKVRANFSKFIDYVVALLQIAKDDESPGDIDKFESEISLAEKELSQLIQQVELRRNSSVRSRTENSREIRTREEEEGTLIRSEARSRMVEETESIRSEVRSRNSHISEVRSRIAEETESIRSEVRSRNFHSKQNEIENIENAKQELDELYRRRSDDLNSRMRELKLASSPNRTSQNDASVRLRGSPTEWTNAKMNERENKEYQINDGLGTDLLKQLKRVPIPIFSGDKRTYASWKAAFYSCVDAANVTPEYKLLQLRSYLRGEALKSIELFGHSSEAYEASKRQLERKFGGERRQIAIRLEELDQFKPIRPGFPKDVEKLADLLEVVVVTMKDAGRQEELGDGTLYMKIQKKLTEEMLTRYRRWSYEMQEPDSVEALKKWLLRESDYQNQAAETLRGLSDRSSRGLNPDRPPLRNRSENSYLAQTTTTTRCVMCAEPHPVWKCPSFACLSVDERWEVAKSEKLCFCCLSATHRSKDCLRAQVCGIDNCKKNHDRLLHATETAPVHQTHNARTLSPEETNPYYVENNNPFRQHSVMYAPAAHVDPREISQQFVREPPQVIPAAPATPLPTGARNSINVRDPFIPFRDSFIPQNEAHPIQEHTHNNHTQENTLSLRTVPVFLENGERRIKVNALLDDASTKTYVNTDVAHELGVSGEPKTVAVGVLGGMQSFVSGESVKMTLTNINRTLKYEIAAQTTTKVTGNMRATEWQRSSRKWSHLSHVNFPQLARRKTVDLLIGADHNELHTALREIHGQPGEPIARLTPLGWTCVGRVNPTSVAGKEESFVSFLCNDEHCQEFQLERFWNVEELPLESDTTITLSKEEEDAVMIAKSTLSRNDNGRFQIRSPWKMLREGMSEEYRRENNVEEIPNNYKEAFKRLLTTEKSVIKKQIKEQYNQVFDQYSKKNYIQKVSKQDLKDTKWLLPHFPILRFDKETTKIRIVMDASAKCQGVSLNDFVLKGPKLQQDLFTIICRLRKKPVAIVCDISEMYLQIELAPEDRKYFRFLWRDCEDRAPDVWGFNRLVFGFSACPFLAQQVARENAEENQEEFPLASEAVLESTYMDDTLDSVENEVIGIQMYQELKELWGRAGMSPRKWLSNSEKVLQNIPKEERAASVDLDNSELPYSKTLGIGWMAQEDTFTFSYQLPENRQFCKRTFLSLMAAIFDPLGFLAAFIITAKIILQELWLEGLGWDDKLPQKVDEKLQRWCDDLKNLSQIRVPRCVRLEITPINTTLHFFSDASKEAYATVAYLRTEYQTGQICVRLICSKSKVAPLKVTSIPRLELMGATMSVRLGQKLMKLFDVNDDETYFWTDSMNVLWWISRRSKTLKTFVANRIGMIHRMSQPAQWRHVEGKVNPADLASRGVSLGDLHQSRLWWNGPEFLSRRISDWPGKLTVNPTPTAEKEEIQKWRNSETSFHIRTITVDEESKLSPKRYSKLIRLIRVTGWVFRFIDNCRSKKEDRLSTELTVEELNDSETSIIRSMQKEHFRNEIEAIKNKQEISKSSQLLTYHPFIDDDGVLRSNSRLTNAEFLTYDVKYPVILPRKEWVTKLIIRSYHCIGEHTKGTNHTLADLSEKYVIPQAREEIRVTEAECNYCIRKKAKPASQIMAPLPAVRLKEPLHAFIKISVDFAGPYYSIQGRGRRRAKRYLCLFTCLLSRGVHLELAYSLDTDPFLNAFYRMTSRRGLPEEAISDNGSNFVSGNRELMELVHQLDNNKIHTSLANKGVKWSFNPPLAPHFGGVHEAMIKSAKKAIYAVLQDADINDEELHTTFVGVEDLLNSRPITYQSSHPADELPLTPNHFLHGRVGGEFAADTVDTVDYVARKRWRRVQELVRHVWSRWMKEWLPELRRRRKWQQAQRDFVVGDIVLIIDADAPRGRWVMGRIECIYPGKDGHVRTVKVNTVHGSYVRPVTKLCRMELHE